MTHVGIMTYASAVVFVLERCKHSKHTLFGLKRSVLVVARQIRLFSFVAQFNRPSHLSALALLTSNPSLHLPDIRHTSPLPFPPSQPLHINVPINASVFHGSVSISHIPCLFRLTFPLRGQVLPTTGAPISALHHAMTAHKQR